MRCLALTCSLLLGLMAPACSCAPETGVDGGVDVGRTMDGGPLDASADAALDGGDVALDALVDGAAPLDGGAPDGGAGDGGEVDGGELDGGEVDGGVADAGTDAGFDAGRDAGVDAGVDAGRDAGTGGCISGGTGTHVVRFRWEGSGAGSTAYVRYEANTLPDTSRWRAGAFSRGSVGYTPRFDDVFLGEGGLDMGGTVFMDVELSTAGLTSIRNVSLAIYGRSFNTTSSGSFTWMSFDGSGAAPSGLVHNSAPYEWYPADATDAFAPGNDGVLLRIEAGPPSDRLVVNSVELCFDAD